MGLGSTLYFLILILTVFSTSVSCQRDSEPGSPIVDQPISTSTAETMSRPTGVSVTKTTEIKPSEIPESLVTMEPDETLPRTAIPAASSSKPDEDTTPTAVITPSPFPPPMLTPTLVLSPTPIPIPQSLPAVDSLAGIGTVVPPAADRITIDNVGELTEVARWGKGSVLDAAYSPDGSRLYVLTEQGVYLYDTATAQQLEHRHYANVPGVMALSPDGQLIAVAMQNKPYYIELRDAVSNSFITAFLPFDDSDSPASQLDFDQHGETLFILSGLELIVWNIATATPATILTDVDSFDFAPQAALAGMKIDGAEKVQLFQWSGGELTPVSDLEIPEPLQEIADNVAVSPNGKYVALGGWPINSPIAVWDVTDGELLYVINSERDAKQSKRYRMPSLVSGPGRGYVVDLRFSPDSQLLAETTGFQNLTLWRIADGQLVQELSEVGSHVIFTPDSAAVGTWQHTLSQWRIEDGRRINGLNQHIGGISDLALIPNQKMVAIASADGFVYLRMLANGALWKSLHAGVSNETFYASPSVRAIDITADGATLVSASNDAYRVWDLDSNDMISLAPSPRGDIGAFEIVISSDGQYIMGKDHDTPAILWQTDKDNEFQETEFISPLSMAFSPSELLLAITGYFADDFILWQPDLDATQDLVHDSMSILSVAFSPDGHYLAAGDDEGTVLLWSIRDMEAQFPYSNRNFGWDDSVEGIAISPDNNLLAVQSRSAVKILEMNNGRLLYTLFTPVSGIGVLSGNEVLFSADGHYLITGHRDGSVRFWAVPAYEPVQYGDSN